MVDVNAQIDAVTRSVESIDADGDDMRVQTLTRTYPSPLADVWDAVTSPDRVPRWFLPVSGDLRLGGRFQLEGNAGGEIQECVPPAAGAAHYRITWSYGGAPDSWVTIRLAAVNDDATSLELEHVARVADTPPGFFEQFGSGATGVGWESGLLGLSLHLADDASIPPSEANAWLLSDEGRAFTRRAADAWSAADIANGMDPDAAARAADGTFAFYTGETPPEAPAD